MSWLSNRNKYNISLLPFIFMMGLFLFVRVLFLLFNNDLLPQLSTLSDVIQVFFVGIQYDFLLLSIFNLPFLLLVFLLPFLNYSKWILALSKMGFIIVNAVLTIVSIADIPYFRFNNRRATSEVFSILGDSSSAFGSFILKYWYFVLIALLLLYFIFFIAHKTIKSKDYQNHRINYTYLIAIIGALIFIGLKGPKLTPKHASLYVSPKYRTIVTNTPSTLLYSFLKGQEKLNQKRYFKRSELKEYFQIHHQYQSEKPFDERNIVLFVLESFSQEYLIPAHPNKAPTPFLDSLIAKSIVFENMYANGATSAYGLMSILGGIPPFLDEAYFATIYGDNEIYGIGSLLKDVGYTTSFFYGAEDDHYGFRKNMLLLGIENYFSKEDFKGDAYDGNWGIYDEPFMQLAADKILDQKQPVFATIFNISSHLPYMVPTELKDKLSKGTMSSHQSLAYVDYAIQHFFEKLQESEMYENTIFLFTADHWAKRRDLEFKNDVGRYRIPFFIYDPQQENHQTIKTITQQLDVMPTMLQYLNYSGKYMSFGNQVLETDSTNSTYRFTYNEYEDVYQIIDSTFVLSFDENRASSFSLFNYKVDADLKDNLLDEIPLDSALENQKNKMETYLKAVIQTYNQHLIENDVNIEPKY